MKRSTAIGLQLADVLLMLLLLRVFEDNAVLFGITLAVGLGIAAWLWYCQRCPHCGALPYKGSMTGKYCPHCGKSLEE